MTESETKPGARPARRKRKGSFLLRTAMLLIGGFALLVAGARLWNSRSDKTVPAATPAALAGVPVVTAKVKTADVPIYLTGLGTVQSTNTVTVRARVDGQIRKIGFVEGQDVRKGDLIAEIDPTPFQAQLATATATKARDEALLANAELDLQRFSSLLRNDYASRQSVDTQKALVAQYAAAVKMDQGQIDFASVQLGYTTIVAPISGRTGMRLVDEGNIVHATDTGGIVVITQLQPITAVFALPEDDLDDIRAAMAKGKLTVLAFGRNDTHPRATGTLELVDNQIDQTTATIKLKARFPNDDHALWPGQFINVRLLLETRKDSLTIPASAVQRGPDGTYAYLVRPDRTVAIQPISVGQIREGVALIEKGLSAGDEIVAAGQYKLKPGARIVPQAAPAPDHVASAGGVK